MDFPTLGFVVCDWIEAFLVHGPGDVEGEPIVLDEEFTRFICHCYRLDELGRRVRKRAVLSRPKGRAKSELAGMLSCVELLGPVRFDGWESDGVPRGRPVRSPFIRNLATEETQVGNTYDNVRAMLTHLKSTGGGEFSGLDVGLTRTLWNKSDGEIRPSSAGAASKDGGRETFAVADEIHLYVLPELKQMHRTVMRNLAKRKAAEPWMLDTTTMYALGELSVAETTMDKPPASILIDHREAPEVDDIYDRSADPKILAALADVYGPAAEWMDLPRLLEEMRDPEETEGNARRYFLNQRHELGGAFVNPDDWAAMADATVTETDRDFVVLGFDGSTADDATALVACRISDGHMWALGIWQPAQGDTVDRVAVDEAVRQAFARFDVWRMHADPPHWQDYLDRWSGDIGDDRIVEFWTNSRSKMGRALERFQTACRERSFTHDGDSTMAAHIRAARARTVNGHLQVGKEHRRSPHKIDATVAAVLAWEARALAVAAGAKPRARGRRVVSF
ncbi:MAG: hypothetical protein ACKOWN_03370 [Microbacteriaceae bacterium]